MPSLHIKQAVEDTLLCVSSTACLKRIVSVVMGVDGESSG